MADQIVNKLNIAVTTPILPDGNVSEEQFKAHIRNLREKGFDGEPIIDGIVTAALNGEAKFLNQKQREQLIQYTGEYREEDPDINLMVATLRATEEELDEDFKTLDSKNFTALVIAPPMNDPDLTDEKMAGIVEKGFQITGLPILLYNTQQAIFTCRLSTVQAAYNRIGKNLLGIKDTQNTDVMTRDYSKLVRREGSSDVLPIIIAQGMDKLLAPVWEEQSVLRDQGLYNYEPTNISGSSNIKDLAILTGYMKHYIKKGRWDVVFEIQNCLNTEFMTLLLWNVVALGGEQGTWKSTVNFEIPDYPIATVENPLSPIKTLTPEQVAQKHATCCYIKERIKAFAPN